MSKICNGVEKSPNIRPELNQYNDYSSEEEVIPFEDGFHGFDRVPAVQLTRIDIQPFLNATNIPSKINSKTELTPHLKRLSQKCIVNLVRDDLSKLIESSRASLEGVSNHKSGIMATDLKCNICKKVYSSERKLNNHQENKHMLVYKSKSKNGKRVSFSDHIIVHEVQQYHKCRKCTKIFSDYIFLKAHMKEQHKKRKCYICNYCSKKFIDRMFFKVHIKLHCDACGLLAQNKTEYQEHRQKVCRILKLYKCRTCNTSFFKYMDLKEHSHEHVITCYVCDICKDQFETKCALCHHITFLHMTLKPESMYTKSKKRVNKKYQCNFCDTTTVAQDAIENHVQKLPDLTNKALTGYMDYFYCNCCLRRFSTEQSMLSHKWTHYLNTSNKSGIKHTININEKLPDSLQPKVVLHRIDIEQMRRNQLQETEKTKTKHVAVNDKSTSTLRLPLLKSILSNLQNSTLNSPTTVLNSTSSDLDISLQSMHIAELKVRKGKTLMSKHQCHICDKYYSSNYCLNRHVETQHSDFENLKCKVCEETFFWPSLLRTHKCIRLNIPEMPFNDARPEIHFDNYQQTMETRFDDGLAISDSDEDYMNNIDFDIPAPIVEIRECDSTYANVQGPAITVIEVPIEFQM